LPRHQLLLILLFAVLAGSTWLAWLQPDAPAIPLGRTGQPLPDYYLSGLDLRQYGPDGRLARLLKAERLTYVMEQGTTLQQPRLTLENAVGAPWVVSGEGGQLDPDGTTLTLPGAVLITRLATPDNRSVRLETRNLQYRMDQGYAETDEAVTVISDRDRIDAVGLQAWLQDPGRIHFRSQVRGHYEP
jgi:LPS export ABC transporter protein LptC